MIWFMLKQMTSNPLNPRTIREIEIIIYEQYLAIINEGNIIYFLKIDCITNKEPLFRTWSTN